MRCSNFALAAESYSTDRGAQDIQNQSLSGLLRVTFCPLELYVWMVLKEAGRLKFLQPLQHCSDFRQVTYPLCMSSGCKYKIDTVSQDHAKEFSS